MSLSTRLELCSEDRPINGTVQRWETEPTLQPTESVFHNGELNLLQRPNWSFAGFRSGRRRRRRQVVFTLLFPDSTKIIAVSETRKQTTAAVY